MGVEVSLLLYRFNVAAFSLLLLRMHDGGAFAFFLYLCDMHDIDTLLFVPTR